MSEPDRRTLEYVVPRIYVSLPNVGEADVKLSVDDCPVERRLAADLLVIHAFDLDTHFELVANRDLARLGVSADELHAKSLANLRALNLEVRAHQGERCTMLTAGGNFEATLLLLPEVWESVQSMVAGNIIASVPARDLIFMTGDAVPENLAELRSVTSKALENADKPLSRQFLRWENGAWSEYAGFAD